MRYKLLGRTGLRVSELCLGTMIFGDPRGPWGATAEDAATILHRYAEAGGNFLDTANYYAQGNSERIVGELIGSERDRWVLGTKYTLSTRPGDPNAGGSHRKSMTRAIEDSLRRLGTDHIDLYWVHAHDRFTPVEEVVRALDDLVRSGKVLYVGVSDTPAWLVSRAVTLAELRGWTSFAGLQVPYNLAERAVERDLLPMAGALDLTVTTWGPLADGLFSGRYGTGKEQPKDTRIGAGVVAGRLTERNLALADLVAKIAAEHGASSAQVAIAWVRAQQGTATVIPIVGARTVPQIEDNLGVLDLELSPDDLAQLDAASAIELGFPHDFGGSGRVYGGTEDLIDSHRR
jgi:aryl-alcohol dehydrogenase-like predicted oxidoreductase